MWVESRFWNYPDQLKGAKVIWSESLVDLVIDGLLTNALKHNIAPPNAFIDISLIIENEGIFIVVVNPSLKKLKDLRIWAQRLTNCRDIDLIGISLIHLACKAHGYKSPRWTCVDKYLNYNNPVLEAKVQVGVIGGIQNGKDKNTSP